MEPRGLGEQEGARSGDREERERAADSQRVVVGRPCSGRAGPAGRRPAGRGRGGRALVAPLHRRCDRELAAEGGAAPGGGALSRRGAAAGLAAGRDPCAPPGGRRTLRGGRGGRRGWRWLRLGRCRCRGRHWRWRWSRGRRCRSGRRRLRGRGPGRRVGLWCGSRRRRRIRRLRPGRRGTSEYDENKSRHGSGPSKCCSVRRAHPVATTCLVERRYEREGAASTRGFTFTSDRLSV